MGKEFVELFEKWAKTYDDSVAGHDIEYKEVFLHYEQILQEVADRSFGHVLEFGPGTGNLTAKLLKNGFQVTAVEPSPSMREIAINKLSSQANILDGDFFNFPLLKPIDTFVSTYAFHHLTDEEKSEAIAHYGKSLAIGSKVVFADTMYESDTAFKKAILDALEKGFHNLAEDLQGEYYTTIPFLRGLMEQNGFEVKFERCNDFVWIMEGVLSGSGS